MTNSILQLILMHFPKRLAALRKEHGYTQAQMAEKVSIHLSQYKRYELAQSQPTLEVFRKMVVSLNVSADHLLFDPDERGPKEDALRLRFEAVSQLEPEEKAVITELIDGMLIKHDAKRWMQAGR